MEEGDKKSEKVIRRVSSKSRRIALRARRGTEEVTSSESEHDEQSPKLARKLEHKASINRNSSQQKYALNTLRPDIILGDYDYTFLSTILGICHINISFFHIWLAASIYNFQKTFLMLAKTVQELPQPERNLNSLSRTVDIEEDSCKSLNQPSSQFARSSKHHSEGSWQLSPHSYTADDPQTCESEDADYVSDHSTYSRPTKSTTELDMSMDESLAESTGRESGYLSGIDISFHNRSSTSSDSPAVSPQSVTVAQESARVIDAYNLKKLEDGIVAEVVTKVEVPTVTLPQQPSLKGDAIADSSNIPDYFTTASLLNTFVVETKYVTAIFEMTVGGIDELLEDVLDELKIWFNDNRGLMGIACEIQWSVPERFRNRTLESRMKSALHASLRENNLRVLNMKNNVGLYLPLTLTAAVTQENCGHDQKLKSFQGIYRRFYESLLPYQHKETSEWHKAYWNLEDSQSLRCLPTPKPQQFIYGSNPTQLDRGSLLALNVIALKLVK